MRRIGLALGLMVFVTVPLHSEMSEWHRFDEAVGPTILQWGPSPYYHDGKWYLGKQELSKQACLAVEQDLDSNLAWMTSTPEKFGGYTRYVDGKPVRYLPTSTQWEYCTQSELVYELKNWISFGNLQWRLYCEAWAKDYEAFKQRERFSSRPDSFKSTKNSIFLPGRSEVVSPQSPPPAVPNSGGAGGSLAQTQAAEAQQQPPAVPNSGGAGGSLAETQGAQPPAAPDKGAERESKLMAGSRSSMVEPYTSQRIPDSGGAGGSQLQQAAIPNSGGAGGSEPTTWGSQPAYSWSAGSEPSVVPNSGGAGGSLAAFPQSQPSAVPNSGGAGGSASACPTQQTQQACDPRSFGDAQLRLLLADPKTRARLASLIAEEPSPRKAKTEQRNRREKRGRAPTDADFAQPNSGTANAIGTVIGVGMGVGLSNVGRRGGTSGMAPRSSTGGAAPRHGTFDGPPR